MSGIFGGAGSRSGVIGTTELDYIEGTWSPVLSDGTNNATMNSGSTGGSYIKIAKVIHIFGRCTTSSLGSVSGGLRITGLPYAVGTGEGSRAGMAIGEAGNFNVGDDDSPSLQPIPTTTYMAVFTYDIGAGSSAMQHGEWSSDGYLIFSGIYKTD